MIRIVKTAPTCIFAFAGRADDKETAVESNLLRHFDPSVGRWLNEEPVGYAAADAKTLHRYAGNQPE
jgi:RHS repeat-associated protein